MVFLSICTALYDYAPQGEGELQIQEGELIYILEKSSDDDWWKAKKKAADEDEDEPVGLIPSNYVEEARPIHHAKALYDYSRQTDEELSFSEDASLLIFDISDPDWTLVGSNGEFGFAPANYIEITGDAEETSPPPALSPPLPTRPAAAEASQEPSTPSSPVPNPAANLASIIGRQATSIPQTSRQSAPAPAQPAAQLTPDTSEEDEPPPSLPQRPISQQLSPPIVRQPSPEQQDLSGVHESPPVNRAVRSQSDADDHPAPGGYRLYHVNEMVPVLGKHKKMPTTLGINLATGVILIIPQKKRDGPQQEWSAEKMTHYSIEGKHVFMELVKPSKSIDFHAGAKDTAEDIVATLGELAGAARAEGLREIIAAGAGSGQRRGHMLYDFVAQGDDEVTVADGDEVIVLDTQSEEWWKVRRVKNGKEGVVPSSYVEAGPSIPATAASPSSPAFKPGLSTVQQNRLEEERLAREAMESSKRRTEQDSKVSEVGPGLRLPNRGSSLKAGHDNDSMPSQRSKRDSRSDSRSAAKSKPDPVKLRMWTDRSGSFKVEAQFIGLKDGKIHLHKVNGVKIAVPVTKMATADLEYVERVTGVSLDEDKPLSDVRKRNQKALNGGTAGASIPGKPEYDWFDFFLKCGVSPYQCERYSSNFNRDSMDESVLSDITPAVLRTLGLKEGDILRVMKFLDNKYGRAGAKSKLRNVSFGGEEVISNGEDGEGDSTSPTGLFSGPGGALRNNTRKGRPAPAVQTSDIVDSKVFQQGRSKEESKPSPRDLSPDGPAPPPPRKDNEFEDDAWDVKPAKQQPKPQANPASQPAASAPVAKPNSPPPLALTGGMADLSLLSQPLQPVIAHNTAVPQQNPPQLSQQAPPQQFQQQQQPQIQQQQQQPQGANPSFFTQLGQQPTGLPPNQQPNLSKIPQQQPNLQQFNQQPQNIQQLSIQPTGQYQNNAAPRQRPQAPPMAQQGSLVLPPPARPLSAPQNVSNQSSFGPPPLQPQLTGVGNQAGFPNQSTSPQQTLNDMNRMRLQQQMGQQQQPQLQQQFTGFVPQGQNFAQPSNGFSPQQTGFTNNLQLQPQMTGFQPSQFQLNGQQTGSPFANPILQPQSTGFQPAGFNPSFNNTLQPQQTGSINSLLPPALQPQSTGINGFNPSGFGQPPPPVPSIPQQFGQSIPPPPPIPQQNTIAPLQAQKTGPAPNVRFGLAPEAKKLVPQPTARKANLAHATPENPFGF